MSVVEELKSKNSWSPTSWKNRPMDQAVAYPDQGAVEEVYKTLQSLPPLVTSWEIEKLRGQLIRAAEGKAFILQGGDCAESFEECNAAYITNKMKIMLQMSLVLMDGLKKPIVRIGRIAGQYAKPRSSATETINGKTVSSYYGDLINSYDFTEEARRPDPKRMVTAYYHSALTLNFIRALVDGGFADLHHPEYWDLNFLGKAGLTNELRADYVRRAASVANAVEVMEVITGQAIDKISTVEFYTSHEGLSLTYESALTRPVPRRPGVYNLGCHLPWIGERTRSLNGAHVEYFRGIRNPIGIKLGPKATPKDLAELLDLVDPAHEPGRLVLIGRFGAGNTKKTLPGLIESVRESGRKPVWICDPMHGNTITASTGHKTRRVDSILQELSEAIDVHASLQSHLGGVHFELTAENVTECIGGASGVTEADLVSCYQSRCDPRLNYEQAMEMAFAIASRIEAMA